MTLINKVKYKEFRKFRKYKPRDKRKILFCQVCGCDIRWKKSRRVVCEKPDCLKIHNKKRKSQWFQNNKQKIYKTMYKWRRNVKLETKKPLWGKYYKLLVKYKGNFDLATQKELDQLRKDNPDPILGRQLAERKYHNDTKEIKYIKI